MTSVLTENEAKQRWCPFARTLDFVQMGADEQLAAASINRIQRWPSGDTDESPGFLGRHRCIASECMAWRAHETQAFKERADAEYARSGKRLAAPGYCGLAGTP